LAFQSMTLSVPDEFYPRRVHVRAKL
jgi:hypothetical protein